MTSTVVNITRMLGAPLKRNATTVEIVTRLLEKAPDQTAKRSHLHWSLMKIREEESERTYPSPSHSAIYSAHLTKALKKLQSDNKVSIIQVGTRHVEQLVRLKSLN